MIRRETRVLIVCNVCDVHGPIAATEATATQAAKDEGWKVQREYWATRHLCPPCARQAVIE